ncbi:uncharacterized protein SAMN05216344_10794 [Polaromonas sp. OV174]|uniref:PP0621 family protein n=1 Tax=Polaromonas sp. OV174 TaxID=1855300 RepID=UPI0008E48FDF|nr:PP0621 family protein [Polaromonas sp. OV174]SFC02012.1 uncharacterized protein SAMN05216344_10794 [Polaromonas sp. OV174]
MKYLLVMALVLVVAWLWRHNRQAEIKEAKPAAPAPQPKGQGVTEIVACDLCQVHLPKSEALIGSHGIYCSDAHRRQAGG